MKLLPRMFNRLATELIECVYKFSAALGVHDELVDALDNRVIGRIITQKKIATGLFAGTPIPAAHSHGSSLLPKLLGTYEASVQKELSILRNTKYSEIVYLGCADGIILAGISRLFPEIQCKGYDIDQAACVTAIRNTECATKNANISILNRAFHWQDISKAEASILFICDIEGAERSLFHEAPCDLLEKCDFIIELHDFLDGSISEAMSSALSSTHQVRLIHEVGADPKDLKGLGRLSMRGYARAADEHRPTSMQWLIATRK